VRGDPTTVVPEFRIEDHMDPASRNGGQKLTESGNKEHDQTESGNGDHDHTESGNGDDDHTESRTGDNE